MPERLKLGARLDMPSGAGRAIHLEDAAFSDVALIVDRAALVRDADVVPCVRPPALEVVDAMKEMVCGDAQAGLVRMTEAVRGLRVPAAA